MNKDLLALNNSVILVTGATGYLGKAMCVGLASAGARILVNSRSAEKADALVNEIKKTGGKAEGAVFDVTDKASIEQYFKTYKGPLNVIVNNAYSGAGGTVETAVEDAYQEAYHVVVTSAHNILINALTKLREAVKRSEVASVINIASMYAVVSPDQGIYQRAEGTNPPFYGAAKAALLQWARYSACEFGKEGIRFNSISPGPFPDPCTNLPEFLEELSAKVPLGRVGVSNEIVGPIAFLSSCASSFVNGANISVDGGWTAW
ncbi:SDR family oxidoreductase [Kangiella sp. TOML190]|uniref:SDR family oxidoreductase n=1 Tax=Kangiella sp. TOML190 TaxID=2931351 RepID=UPI00203A7A78|nr:SDR family oxidoreductase [Kangiella sp. TOML190]